MLSSIAYTSPRITQNCPVLYALEVTSFWRVLGQYKGHPFNYVLG